MTYIEVVCKYLAKEERITAHLSAQSDVMLNLSSLSNVQKAYLSWQQKKNLFNNNDGKSYWITSHLWPDKE